jgi:hypothetical protein
MRRIAAIVCMILPVVGQADGLWLELDGPRIQTALADQKLVYTSASQTFYASGKTLYNQGGRDSWGYWRVQGNQYCSQWPPNDLWACFDILARGDEIRFRGFNGDVTDGTYAE